jgi:hypothetical protein
MEIGTAGLSDFWGSDPVMATVMMHGVGHGLTSDFQISHLQNCLREDREPAVIREPDEDE